MLQVKRTLTYRRAIWTARTADRNLEHYIRLIHQRLKTTQARTFDYSDGQIQGLAWRARQNLVLVHIAQYVPEGSTSLVPMPSGELISNTLELEPPRNTNFLRGDIMFLVAGDHLLMCSSGAREAVISGYLEAASDKLSLGSWTAQCKLEPVADVSKIRLIRTEGVKRIRLNASLYEATLAYEEARERKTVHRSVMGHLGEAIRDLFRSDPRLADIGEEENISVRIELSYDQRRRGGAIGQRRMENMAQNLINEDEEGFRIVTREDKIIQADELRLQQVLPLDSSGSTVKRDAAWSALEDFYHELISTRALET